MIPVCQIKFVWCVLWCLCVCVCVCVRERERERERERVSSKRLIKAVRSKTHLGFKFCKVVLYLKNRFSLFTVRLKFVLTVFFFFFFLSVSTKPAHEVKLNILHQPVICSRPSNQRSHKESKTGTGPTNTSKLVKRKHHRLTLDPCFILL